MSDVKKELAVNFTRFELEQAVPALEYRLRQLSDDIDVRYHRESALAESVHQELVALRSITEKLAGALLLWRFGDGVAESVRKFHRSSEINKAQEHSER